MPIARVLGKAHGFFRSGHQCARLCLAFALLIFRRRVGNYSCARLRVHHTILQHCGAQHDAAVHIAIGCEITDAACIGTACFRFQLGDDFAGADLGCAADGARRETREESVERIFLIAKPAHHIRNNVHHMAVEFYSHVMHIVSNVVGRLGDEKDALDALFAGFPAGTVSGAPKVRACEIIAELEPETRGAYAGGVGYFAPDGNMDSCIVLRTAVLKDGVMHAQAGAGIVADSTPEYEQRECEAKAGALMAAAKEAVRLTQDAGYGQ